MLTALKWSGTSVTVGSLVAATTVRVIAGGAEVVCAVPEAGSAIAPSNSSTVVLNCIIASQVQRIIGAPYALPAPLGMAGRFEMLLDGNREQRPSETEFVAVGVNQVKEALTPFGIAGHGSWLVSLCRSRPLQRQSRRRRFNRGRPRVDPLAERGRARGGSQSGQGLELEPGAAPTMTDAMRFFWRCAGPRSGPNPGKRCRGVSGAARPRLRSGSPGVCTET